MINKIHPPLPDLWSTKSRRRSAVITGISGYHQLDSYSCGTAAVSTVIRAYSNWLDADSWFTAVFHTNPCPLGGTPTRRLRRALHELGFKSTLKRTFNASNVCEAIRQGDLIITTVRMPSQPPNATHWVVVCGCSPEDVLILNATGYPLFSKRWIPWEDIVQLRDRSEVMVQIHLGLTDWVSDRYPDSISPPKSRIARLM